MEFVKLLKLNNWEKTRNKPELTSNSGKFNLLYSFRMKIRCFRQEKRFGLKQIALLKGLSGSYIN